MGLALRFYIRGNARDCQANVGDGELVGHNGSPTGSAKSDSFAH
jgi:hypothetical protein